MKVIFLDVDGVLNSMEWCDRVFEKDNIDVFLRDMLDPDAIARLKRIVDATGAEIVVSSSWRHVPSGMRALEAQLAEFGLKKIGTTPDSEEKYDRRGHEIKMWLDEHPDVTHFVVLDDDDDMGPVMDHFVQTTFAFGLLDRHVDAAIEKLNM